MPATGKTLTLGIGGSGQARIQQKNIPLGFQLANSHKYLSLNMFNLSACEASFHLQQMHGVLKNDLLGKSLELISIRPMDARARQGKKNGDFS